MKQKIYVVGIGPGAPKMMTPQARQALEESDVIAGYPVYLKLLGDLVQNKKTIATPMTKEEERCRLCFEEAKKGCIASIVCSRSIQAVSLRLFRVLRQQSAAQQFLGRLLVMTFV